MSTPLVIPPVVEAYLNLVQQTSPAVSIRAKEDSTLMKVIGFLVKPFNPSFNERYTTTIGNTIWMPSKLAEALPEETYLEIVAHEVQHIRDDEERGVFFKLGYLFPQVLALLSLLAIGAIWSPWWLLWLLSLLFLLPFPAYWRYQAELNGYRTSILFNHFFERSTSGITKLIISQLAGPSYYFAWPFKTRIERDLNDTSFLLEPRYAEITEFLTTWYRR